MIHLIRRFVNNGQVPLNVTIESIKSYFEGTIKPVLDETNSNTNLLKSESYGLSALKNLLDKVVISTSKLYVPGNSVAASPNFYTGGIVSKTNYREYTDTVIKVTDNFIPESSGILNIDLSATLTINSNNSTGGYGYLEAYIVSLGSSPRLPDNTAEDTYKTATAASLLEKGAKLIENSSTDITGHFSSKALDITKIKLVDANSVSLSATGTATKTASVSTPIIVEKGFPVFVLLLCSSYASYNSSTTGYVTATAKVNSISVKGSIV